MAVSVLDFYLFLKMVNELRTLLLNEQSQPGAVYEQYIEPSFVSLILPEGAATLRNLLIPSRYSRAYKNFLATILTRFVYESKFAQILNGIDSRQTIDWTQSQAPGLNNTITLTRVNNANSVNIIGTYSPDEYNGIFIKNWKISNYSSSQVLITDLDTGNQNIQSVTFSGDVSGIYPFDNRSLLYYQFVGINSVPVFQATVQATAPMTFDLLHSLNLLNADSGVLDIFSSASNNGVMQLLMNSFYHSTSPQEQLAAILTAFVLYSTENL